MPIYTEGQIVPNSQGEPFQMQGGKWVPAPTGATPAAPPLQIPDAPGKIPESQENPLTGAMDTATGLGKAVGSGVVHDFVPGVLGIPGDVQKGAQMAGEYLGDKARATLGKEPLTEEQAASLKPATGRQFTAPGQNVIRSGISKVIPDYEPKNTAEEVAKTFGGMAPMAALAPGGMGIGTMLQGGLKQGGKEMMSALTRFGVAPALGSEGAGAIAPEGWETPAKIAGALAAPSVARSIITPNSIRGATTGTASAYKQAVDNLKNEHGIGDTLMPSQLTNNRIAAGTERALADTGGSKTETRFIDELNHQALTNAAFKYAGAKGAKGTPDVIAAMEKNANKLFNDLTSDKRLVVPFAVKGVNNNQSRAVNKILDEYERTSGSKNPTRPREFVERIEELASKNTGKNKDFLTAEQYQSLRSQLSAKSRDASNAGLKRAYGQLADVLDDSMGNVIGKYFPDRVGKFDAARENWKNHLVVKEAVDPVTGLIKPDKLMAAVRSVEGAGASLRKTNPLARLAADASTVMTPLSSAEKAANSLRHDISLATVLAGGGAAAGSVPGASHGSFPEAAAGGIGGALIGALLPKTMAKAAFMRGRDTMPSQALTQQWRGNQLAPAIPLSQNKAQQLMIMRALGEGRNSGE